MWWQNELGCRGGRAEEMPLLLHQRPRTRRSSLRSGQRTLSSSPLLRLSCCTAGVSGADPHGGPSSSSSTASSSRSPPLPSSRVPPGWWFGALLQTASSGAASGARWSA